MQITRVSLISGIERTREIDVTQAQIDAWQSGTLIQKAMPNLSDDDREFMLTGITQDEWDEAFPDE